MPKSYRFRTVPGVDRNVRVKIDQDFDFLEILSLKLRQEDLYSRFCADYGVVAGRVIANGGYGVPNVNVSIFIPLSSFDENNPIISTLYPYKTPEDKNEDGFRYNLLPYVQEYGGHTPTGTFPSREDLLTRKEVLEVYEKYYKYTVKTNDSGDFMIVGVPLGQQKIVMDLDLSNIGQFSLRPSDLIRMGLGVPLQFDGQQFKKSENIDSLPQIIHQVLDIDVASFWGQEDLCDVGITRVDFDLREIGVEIVPTSVFMGSIFSSTDRKFLKKNCKPKTEQGDICELVTGAGEILAVRQTIFEDEYGDPVLEQYFLENGGNVIDDNGAFVTEIPMNMDYVVTNEFGEQILSNDPNIGIPTRSKYRFKIKYQSEETGENTNESGGILPIKGSVIRANFLVPQVREYGWEDSDTDPSTFSSVISTNTLIFNDTNRVETQTIVIPTNTSVEVVRNGEYKKIEISVNGQIRNEKWIDFPTGGNLVITITKNENGGVFTPSQIQYKQYDYRYSQFQKSYAFSLDLNEYADKSAAINCDDFFYNLTHNKVYTTAQLVDEYRNGNGRARFLGIKEVLDRTCESETNKFPINDGVRNFDLIYFLFNFLLTILTPVFYVLIFLVHTVCFLWPVLRLVISFIATYLVNFLAAVCNVLKLLPGGFIEECPKFQIVEMSRNCPLTTIALPNLSYPDCNFCECPEIKPGDVEFPEIESNYSFLVDTNTYYFFDRLLAVDGGEVKDTWMSKYAYGFRSVMSGFDNGHESNLDKCPVLRNDDNPFTDRNTWSYDLPLSEKFNLFNVKANYHNPANGNNNIIRARINPDLNGTTFYEDNIMMLVVDSGLENIFTSGSVISFQNPTTSNDPNPTVGVTGTSVFSTNTQYPIDITYMDPTTLLPVTKSFIITGDTITNQEYTLASDVEYFQIITGQTLSEFENTLNTTAKGLTSYDVPNSTLGQFTVFGWQRVQRSLDFPPFNEPVKYPDTTSGFNGMFETNLPNIKLHSGWETLRVLFLVRGVDTHSPTQDIEYDLSKIYGYSTPQSDLKIRGQYKLNIPIQAYQTPTDWRIPRHDEFITNNTQSIGQYIFYPSYTFTPSTDYTIYTTKNHQYYSAYDWENRDNIFGNSFTSTNHSTTQVNSAISISNSGSWWRKMENAPDYYFNYRPFQVLEGGSGMFAASEIDYNYFSPVYYRTNPTHQILMTNKDRIVMRTDRLPTSDVIDRRFVLHQNKKFAIYVVDEDGQVRIGSVTSDINGFDNDNISDIPGDITSRIIDSFSCDNMVPLKCYSGNSDSFGVYPDTDPCHWMGDSSGGVRVMQNGCYYLVRQPFKNILQDFSSFTEWKSRFRMMFALCRNVIGMSFVNNWVNGSLYMYTFQKVDRYNNLPNETKYLSTPNYDFCRDTIIFQEINNSFFYRSSPYDGANFIGKVAPQNDESFYDGSNKKLLGNPTTMMDMGPIDRFIKEITFSSEYLGFVVNDVPSTTYKDTSDILQLFIISRIANAGFWENVLGAGDASISKLFSRTNSRIDGDLAQLVSINSEFGVFPFFGNNYSDTQISYNVDDDDNPTVGIFFSANTQTRDYITPGREAFIDTFLTYKKQDYGFRDQEIPYYKWSVENTTEPTSGQAYIFGTDKNEWTIKSKDDGFGVVKYQSIDRLLNNPTFQTQQMNPTTNRPGYIFNSSETPTGVVTYKEGGIFTPEILVGLPYHFYFGLKVGKTAMNRFTTKYVHNQEKL